MTEAGLHNGFEIAFRKKKKHLQGKTAKTHRILISEKAKLPKQIRKMTDHIQKLTL